MIGKVAAVLPAILFAGGSLLFLIGNIIIIARGLK